jgi:hypothetical protein
MQPGPADSYTLPSSLQSLSPFADFNRMYCIAALAYKPHSRTAVADGKCVAKAKFSHQAEVASVKCSADRERGALSGLGMRRHENLKPYPGQGGTLRRHR